MEELLKAILMERMSDREKKALEMPITISFTKEKGLDVPCETKIEGNFSGLIVGCSEIVSLSISNISHGNKIVQIALLEQVYKMAKEKLSIK